MIKNVHEVNRHVTSCPSVFYGDLQPRPQRWRRVQPGRRQQLPRWLLQSRGCENSIFDFFNISDLDVLERFGWFLKRFWPFPDVLEYFPGGFPFRCAITTIILTFFGRTDLWITLSGATFDEDADPDVCSVMAPQKPSHICQNLNF